MVEDGNRLFSNKGKGEAVNNEGEPPELVYTTKGSSTGGKPSKTDSKNLFNQLNFKGRSDTIPEDVAQSNTPLHNVQQSNVQQSNVQQANMPLHNAQQANAPVTHTDLVAPLPKGVQEIDLFSDIKMNLLEKFPKMVTGQTDRVSFVLFSEEGAPRLKHSTYFYCEKPSTLFLAPQNKQLLMDCVKVWDEPKLKFGCILLKYKTDQEGNLLQTKNSLGFDFTMYAYTFSTDKFPVFKSLQREWNLATRDLTFTCSDDAFQKITVQPCQDGALWRYNEECAQRVLEDAENAYNSSRMNRLMGRELSDNDIMQLIAKTTNPGQMNAAGALANNININPAAGAGVNAGAADFSNLKK